MLQKIEVSGFLLCRCCIYWIREERGENVSREWLQPAGSLRSGAGNRDFDFYRFPGGGADVYCRASVDCLRLGVLQTVEGSFIHENRCLEISEGTLRTFTANLQNRQRSMTAAAAMLFCRLHPGQAYWLSFFHSLGQKRYCPERMEDMELELKKNSLNVYDVGAECTLTQEETAETIVPDYCPDIARIIETEGKVFLHSREIHEGKAEISGTVRVTVLYTPDGESGIRTLEFAMPFSAVSDAKTMQSCTTLLATSETEFLETRVLNPRKVFTRCKLVSKLTGYQNMPLEFTSDVMAEPRFCVEKKCEQQRMTVLTHLAEKDFTFSDELSLSSNREGAAEILSSRVTSAVTETKIVGNKLILKGIFTVGLLYRSASGNCCSASGELPFSQIMEVEDAAESADVQMQIQLTGADVQVGGSADQDGRQIAVTLYFHATALLHEDQTVTMLTDLYSTAYELNCEAAPIQVTDYSNLLTKRQTVREILEIGVVASSVLSMNVQCGSISVSRDGASATLRAIAAMQALYLDEGNVPLVTERSIEIACQMEIPENCTVSAQAVCMDDVQGSLGERGIEIRFTVEFRALASAKKQQICISSAAIDMETPKNLAGMPSLVLRAVDAQETLWSLAKKYSTTIPVILAANGLEKQEDVPPEKLLLIPRKRA
jgi:hypothetical protein